MIPLVGVVDKTNVLGVFYTAQAAAKYWVKTKFTTGEPPKSLIHYVLE